MEWGGGGGAGSPHLEIKEAYFTSETLSELFYCIADCSGGIKTVFTEKYLEYGFETIDTFGRDKCPK